MVSIYKALVDIEKNHQSASLCTVVNTRGSTPRHTASKMLVYKDGHIIGTVGGGELENRIRKEALEAMVDGKPRFLSYKMNDPASGDAGVCGGQVEVYVEPIVPAHTIVIVGGGHVGKAVAHLAKWLGYWVVITDDRAEFCTLAENPDADQFFAIPMADLPSCMEITPRTVVILTTRGSQVDAAGLPSLLETQAGYIGVIGSRKRWAETCKLLNEMGITDEQLKRVHSPIGLGIGAETPEEIAVSILAEVLMSVNNGSGKQMRNPR